MKDIIESNISSSREWDSSLSHLIINVSLVGNKEKAMALYNHPTMFWDSLLRNKICSDKKDSLIQVDLASDWIKELLNWK